jgi:hypothetical protein
MNPTVGQILRYYPCESMPRAPSLSARRRSIANGVGVVTSHASGFGLLSQLRRHPRCRVVSRLPQRLRTRHLVGCVRSRCDGRRPVARSVRSSADPPACCRTAEAKPEREARIRRGAGLRGFVRNGRRYMSSTAAGSRTRGPDWLERAMSRSGSRRGRRSTARLRICRGCAQACNRR